MKDFPNLIVSSTQIDIRDDVNHRISNIINNLKNDTDLKKTDKILKIILFAAVFELLFKHNNPKKVIINEYLLASEHFLEKIQIGYLNAILDKIAKVIRKGE